MYIRKEYCPGLHMNIYTYDNKEEAEKMHSRCEFSTLEYDEISKTWKLKIF